MPDARTETPAAKPQAATPDWRASLPADWTAPGRDESGQEVQIPLRQHPALAKYATKDEAIKALVHAQRLLGKKGEPGPAQAERSLLSMTAPEASQNNQAAPPSPEDYQLPELSLPEDFRVDENMQGAFLAKAHELGLTDAQAGGLYAWFLPLNVQACQQHQQAQVSSRVQRRQNQLGALRQTHGDAAHGVMENARKAVIGLGGEALLGVLEQTGAADDARVVQAFARIAPLVTEAGLRGQNAAPAPSLTPQRLREMMRDPRYYDPSRRDSDYVRQVQQGFDTLFPGEEPASRRVPS